MSDAGNKSQRKDRPQILVVDDEQDILDVVQYNLKRAGYGVHCLTSGDGALEVARRDSPHLIVLDLMLPGLGGLEVCRLLKADSKTAAIPIIMLTAKGEERDVVRGLDSGADDYVAKPFSPKVLLSRVKAVLRRAGQDSGLQETSLEMGDLVIHTGRHEVTVQGKPVDLTLTEYNILLFLAQRPGWAFSRYQIVDAVRGQDYPVTERSVDVQIVGLRKKLGPCGKDIQTVRGIGYRFKA
ncbi:MAG: response regulator [bacterium]|nr:response regulator [bacterium]